MLDLWPLHASSCTKAAFTHPPVHHDLPLANLLAIIPTQLKGRGSGESTRPGVATIVVSTGTKELKRSHKQVEGCKELRHPSLFEGNLLFEPLSRLTFLGEICV